MHAHALPRPSGLATRLSFTPHPTPAHRARLPAPRATEGEEKDAASPPTPPSADAAAASAEEATPAAVRRRVAGRKGGGKGSRGGRGAPAKKIDDFNPVAMGRKSR